MVGVSHWARTSRSAWLKGRSAMVVSWCVGLFGGTHGGIWAGRQEVARLHDSQGLFMLAPPSKGLPGVHHGPRDHYHDLWRRKFGAIHPGLFVMRYEVRRNA